MGAVSETGDTGFVILCLKLYYSEFNGELKRGGGIFSKWIISIKAARGERSVEKSFK